MSPKRQIRCAIYTRKSSDEGLEQEFNSLDAQREACEAYVASQKAEGWIVLSDQYDDGGYSGGTLERPALQRLIRDIEAGRVDVVAVYKIDRLSRSLLDFTKMVDTFDRKSVTFVSITQSFNTTTCMGRLTLNVLLSFAQFERELTSERIRDKFAASKKKGMWMGGCPPLGYDIGNRRLLVNFAEAESVNLIFQRYLELGCVSALKADINDKGVASKHWTSSTGITHGGTRFERGALYCLLKNRLYIGETTHKGATYRGEHEAIVPRDLFDTVQQRLAISRRRQRGKASARQDAPLAGLLFDEGGMRMAPTYSVKPGGRRYRYYVGRPSKNRNDLSVRVSRVPAAPLENMIASALARLSISGAGTAAPFESSIGAYVLRVEIGSASLAIHLHRSATLQRWRQTLMEPIGDRDLIARQRSKLTADEELSDQREHFILRLPMHTHWRGRQGKMQPAPGPVRPSHMPDAALIRAVARAHRWLGMLTAGQIASGEALAAHVKQERRHVGRTLSLAFLSPDITRAILLGGQPEGLRLTHLLDADIPHSWDQQREMFDRLATAR